MAGESAGDEATVVAAAVVDCGSAVAAAPLSDGFGSSSIGSSAPATTAIGVPIGTAVPSLTRCCRTTPDSGASTSTVALSVSISASTWPFSTGSPTARTQRTRVPSAMSKPSLGMVTTFAITSPP